MRRLTAILSAASLALVLLGPAAVGVSAASVDYLGFPCDPHGTTAGSPTTTLSQVRIDTTTPSRSLLTCLFRGTRLPASFGGACRFQNATFIVDFARRTLLPVNGNTNLLCSGATTISGNTDLAVTKTDNSATAIPGTDTTYTITVSNNGPNPVSGASVTDTFPAAITSATWTAVGAGGASGFTASGSGSIADTVTLPVGASITYTVTAHIDPSATSSLVNTASVAMPVGLTDPTPGNNSASDTDTLTPQIDIAVTIDDGVTSIPAGTPTTWTITVTNNGPSTATNVLQTSFNVPSISGNCTSGSMGGVGAAPGTMLPGASASGGVRQAAMSPGPCTLTADASFAGAETDTNPANNTGTNTTNVTPVS